MDADDRQGETREAIEDLSEAEADDVLTLIRHTDPSGDEPTRALQGIDGPIDTIQPGLSDRRESWTHHVARRVRARRALSSLAVPDDDRDIVISAQDARRNREPFS